MLAAAVSALLAAAPAQATVTPPERALLRAVNDARHAYGLRSVRISARLQVGAHRWARRIIWRNAFVHDVALRPGMFETLAVGGVRAMSARAVVSRWLRSPSHRRALLWGRARHAGFGVWRGELWGYRGMQASVARFTG